MRHKKLFNNTVMLYLLTFSNYLFNFITVPYQTRILGPEIYGNIGFASAFTIYITLILDFGFLLSATEEVSRNKDNPSILSSVFTSVTISKLILCFFTTIILGVLCSFIERFREDKMLFTLYYISAIAAAFLPDYLYRGLEQMRSITVRSVTIRFFFTIAIFIFLRRADQYYLIPFFNLCGNLGAVLASYFHVTRKIGINFCRVKISDVFYALRRSSLFFYSRIASTLYSVTNTFVLGIIYGDSSAVVGYYTSADKLISTGKQGITPITDSLYPHMIVRKDYALVRRLLLIFMPLITAGCVFGAIFSYDICKLFFGEEFQESGLYLRYMMPILWFSFPAMIFGFPVMSPMGLAKYANLSNILGAAFQIIQMLILFVSGQLTALNICIITCVTEGITMMFRMGVVGYFYYRRKRA